MKTGTKIFTIGMMFSTLLLSSCAIEEKIKDLATENLFISQPSETVSKPTDPARVLPQNPSGCPLWSKNSIVEITESISLPRGCKYDRVQLRIKNKSDLVLNCNGAELNGLETEFRQALDEPYSASRAPLTYGISIISNENSQSKNITIKNCILRNFVRGISVSFNLNSESKNNLKNNLNILDTENYLRERSPKNIRVENSQIYFSHRDGIFIGRYITDFVLKNTTIKNTGAVGLYLDSGSQKNTVEGSTFSQNGHSIYNGNKRVRTRRLKTIAREGIAIDSSAYNTIQNNTFSENAGGSIFIYKNCNEHHASQIPRYQSADNNLVSQNVFNNESVAVWIASRQSKDLKNWDCGSPLMATDEEIISLEKVETRFYEDFAKNNQVINNTFKSVRRGIKVEDDNNIIRANSFSGSATYDIRIGTKYRTQEFSHPVTNTTIENNVFDSDASTHIKYIHNPVDTNLSDNTPASTNSP